MVKKRSPKERIASTIKKLMKQVDDLERMNKTGMTEKDRLKFKAETFGISQKKAKALFGMNKTSIS